MGFGRLFKGSGVPAGNEETLSSNVAGRAPSRLFRSRAEQANGTFDVGGVKLELMEDPDNLSLSALQNSGAYVWPPALVLSDFMVHRTDNIRGARVLELGAGQGLCGLVAASLGARLVCFTERLEPVATPFPCCDPDAMSDAFQDAIWEELMEEYRRCDDDVDQQSTTRILKRPGSDRLLQSLKRTIGRTTVAIMERRGEDMGPLSMVVEELSFGDKVALDWAMQSHGPFELVLGSDITYMSQVRPALMATLLRIRASTSPSPVTVWLSHMKGIPGSLENVMEGLDGAGFRSDIVHEREGVVVLECKSALPLPC
jgi:hypothetical protein